MNSVWCKIAMIAGGTMLTGIAHAGRFINRDMGNPDLILHPLGYNGRYVAFASSADQLVGGDRNGVADIFVREMQTGNIRRASTSTFGLQARSASADSAISANGRYVAFTSLAGNLVEGDTNQVCDRIDP